MEQVVSGESRPNAGCGRGMRRWNQVVSGEIRPNAGCGNGMQAEELAMSDERECGMQKGRDFM
jgi:hypothetical protein